MIKQLTRNLNCIDDLVAKNLIGNILHLILSKDLLAEVIITQFEYYIPKYLLIIDAY